MDREKHQKPLSTAGRPRQYKRWMWDPSIPKPKSTHYDHESRIKNESHLVSNLFLY